MTGFDSIQVRFKHTHTYNHHLRTHERCLSLKVISTVLKSVIDDVKTEYFWFFANFVDLKTSIWITFPNSMNETRYMFGTTRILQQGRQCVADTYKSI